MNEELKKEIMRLHNKGLTKFYIATKLKIPSGIAQKVIEEEIKKDHQSLFN